MDTRVSLTLTDAGTGSPVRGIPITAAGQGTPLATTDRSGEATILFEGSQSFSTYSEVYITPVPPAVAGAVFTTWDLALVFTDTNTGKPIPAVTVTVQGSGGQNSNVDGKSTVRFKLFASPAQALQMSVTPAYGKVTIIDTTSATVIGVSDVIAGTTLETFSV